LEEGISESVQWISFINCYKKKPLDFNLIGIFKLINNTDGSTLYEVKAKMDFETGK
jgi:hypothetical protein